MLSDYKVRWKSSEYIQDIALQWRRAAGWTDIGPVIGIVKFIQATLAKSLDNGLDIKLFRRSNLNISPASVSFNPVTLNVDERIWRQAQISKLAGHRDARYILAHEIGHIVLHGDHKKAFSQIDGTGRFYQQEESSEWQANKFARFFLMGNLALCPLYTLENIAEYFQIPVELARDMICKEAHKTYEGEACPECQNFTLVRNGTCLKCDTCGSTTGCS